jgi:hypothetical protein
MDEEVRLIDHYLVRNETTGKSKKCQYFTEAIWVSLEANRKWPDDDVRLYEAYFTQEDQTDIKYKLMGGNHVDLEELK